MPRKVKPIRREPLIAHLALGQVPPGRLKPFLTRQERVCAKMISIQPAKKSRLLMTNEEDNDVCLMYGNCNREQAQNMCLIEITLVIDMTSDEEDLEGLQAMQRALDDALERIWNTMATTSISEDS